VSHLATAGTSSAPFNNYLPLIAVALGWVLGVFGETLRSRRAQSLEHRQAQQDLQRATYLELQDKLGELWNCVRGISQSFTRMGRWDRSSLPESLGSEFADLMIRIRVLGTRVSDDAVRFSALGFLDAVRASVWEASEPPDLEQLFNAQQQLLAELGVAILSLVKR
jgi:hypothetical protein